MKYKIDKSFQTECKYVITFDMLRHDCLLNYKERVYKDMFKGFDPDIEAWVMLTIETMGLIDYAYHD